MLAGVYQSAAILFVVVAYYVMDFALIARYDRHRAGEGSRRTSGRSWDYTLALALALGFVTLQPVLFPWMGAHVEAAWGLLVQITGAALATGGLALHGWARLHLRQFYAERVELQESHRLVDTGPYAHVRHPTFTAFFIGVVGLLLVNPALPTLLLTLYTFWDFSRAARQEEALLSRNVPGYAEYMARTPPFFPRLRVGSRPRSGDR